MPQPFDYVSGFGNPLQNLAQGMSVGEKIGQLQQKQEQQKVAREQNEQRNKMLFDLMNNKNPTARDFVNIAMLLPEKEAKSMRANWDTLNKDQQENELRFTGQVLSSLNSDKPEIAQKMLKQYAETKRNAGQDREAAFFEGMAKTDPKIAMKTIGIMLASVPGGDKTLEAAIKAQKAPSEIRSSEARAAELEVKTAGLPAKQAADLRSIDSQIENRSKRFNLDKDKFVSDVQFKLSELDKKAEEILPPDARKLINTAAIAAVESEQTAGRLTDLATRIEAAGGGKGAGTTATEFLAKASGQQDAWTRVRQEYIRLKNTMALKRLPPGPASDKDIAFVQKGFPPESANAEAIAQFLRGIGKLEKLNGALKSSEADWVNSVLSLGRARRDIQIGDTRVPAGTSFADFARQLLEREAASWDVEVDRPAQAQQRQTRSYMRWAEVGE